MSESIVDPTKWRACLTPSQVREARNMESAGHTRSEVARRMGVSPETLRRLYARLGISRSVGRPRRGDLDEVAILMLQDEPLTVADLAWDQECSAYKARCTLERLHYLGRVTKEVRRTEHGRGRKAYYTIARNKP